MKNYFVFNYRRLFLTARSCIFFSTVYATNSHSKQIKSLNKLSLFGWGNGIFGQTGSGSEKSINDVPEEVNFNLTEQSLIFAGSDASGIVTSDGKFYVFGRSRDGTLGNTSTFLNIVQPKPFTKNLNYSGNPISVSFGKQHGGLVTDTGELYLWGVNSKNQLGIATTEGKDFRNNRPKAANQKFLEHHIQIEGVKFKSVKCGFNHTV